MRIDRTMKIAPTLAAGEVRPATKNFWRLQRQGLQGPAVVLDFAKVGAHLAKGGTFDDVLPIQRRRAAFDAE